MMRFGMSGADARYQSERHKSSLDIPAYCASLGLDAYEYQCNRGVNISPEKAAEFGQRAKENDISVSVHAPYYISLSGIDSEIRNKSLTYIADSARAVHAMGGQKVVVHAGSAAKLARRDALDLALSTLSHIPGMLKELELQNVLICLETMGKLNQLGTLDEIVEMCRLDDCFAPCVDFGHLNARSQGGLKTRADFEAVFKTLENGLGRDKMRCFHIHFTKIQYGEKGELRHLTMQDKQYGPDFEELADLLLKYDCYGTVLSESAGTQGDDAVMLKKIYTDLATQNNQ